VTALLEVGELAVRFGDEVDALRGVSLRLERGESLAIVGESGAGKSTLALCLAGLIQPPEARGSVQIGGQELLGASGQELDRLRWETVAVALQGAPFNPVISVGDQVAEPLRERRGMSARDARRRAGELASEVLLDEGVLERHPHQISGGERRRAALATALALDPDLLVLDEPVGGLDPATRRDLVERIAALRESRGFGLIVISHDIPEAAELAERSLVLYAGETMEEGPTSHMIGEPAHPYSFALIGAYPLSWGLHVSAVE
jgi:peptide/nickel transport system ATP-binding protein